MASDYGLNFGFRISDESVRLSNGRVRTPAGSSLLLGTAVTMDPAAPGYLKVAPADAPMEPYAAGLLVQEEIWDRSIYEKTRVDSFDLGFALPDRLSVITTGAGTKVWMKNTVEQDRIDGRNIPAVTMFDATGFDQDTANQLGWDGTTWIVVGQGGVTEPWLRVTEYDASKNYLEAVFLK